MLLRRVLFVLLHSTLLDLILDPVEGGVFLYELYHHVRVDLFAQEVDWVVFHVVLEEDDHWQGLDGDFQCQVVLERVAPEHMYVLVGLQKGDDVVDYLEKLGTIRFGLVVHEQNDILGQLVDPLLVLT